jgi:predicted alpha/beta-fold hydrolase
VNYTRPIILFNKHIETIHPALFRTVHVPKNTDERIATQDGDFLDLKWYTNNSKKLVIISHGLEGNFDRAYIKGMAKAFYQSGFDALTWNYRGCGSEMNRTSRFYHSGATDDLNTVVLHAIKKDYEMINLVGFSLGGNITLKYLGENYNSVSHITRAVAISVPLNLDTSCTVISKRENWPYSYRFLKSLKHKVREKSKQMELINVEKLNTIKNIRDFDEWITGPLHGFKNAQDYYTQCSSIHFLPTIKTQTLIINAKNDPFLSSECYPKAINTDHINYLYPDHGGHVGFTLFNKKNLYWSELMTLEFIFS